MRENLELCFGIFHCWPGNFLASKGRIIESNCRKISQIFEYCYFKDGQYDVNNFTIKWL